MRCQRPIQGLASLLVSLALLWGSGPACMLTSSLAKERARCCCERAVERSGGAPIACPHCAASRTLDAQRHPGYRTACSPGSPASPVSATLGLFDVERGGKLSRAECARALAMSPHAAAPSGAASLEPPPPRSIG